MNALEKLEKTLSEDQYEFELTPRVPDAEYTFRLESYYTAEKFGTPRLELRCAIVDPGPFFGVKLSRWYCLESIKGKPGKGGRFIPKKTGDFLIEFCRMFPDYNPRRDRFSLGRLYNVEFTAKTRTVSTNNQQKKLPEQLKHSVIAELLGIT